MSANRPKKSYMIVHRQPPHISIGNWEAINLSLTLAAFEQQLSIVYLGDAVYQLLQNQDTTQLGMKNYSVAANAYHDYHIQHIYVLQHELDARNILTDALLLAVTPLAAAELKDIIRRQDVIIHF